MCGGFGEGDNLVTANQKEGGKMREKRDGEKADINRELADEIGVCHICGLAPEQCACGWGQEDPRIKAVRDDKLVGRGTCSSIDECWGDNELLELLDGKGWFDGCSVAKSPREAVKMCRHHDALILENALNNRHGADDDPELLAWNEWKKARKDNPIKC